MGDEEWSHEPPESWSKVGSKMNPNVVEEQVGLSESSGAHSYIHSYTENNKITTKITQTVPINTKGEDQ